MINEEMQKKYVPVGKPFMEEYLLPLMDLIRLVFIKFNENNNLDIFAQIDEYMRNNEARAGMDRGLPKFLNMGWKQVYNRNSVENIPIGKKVDDCLLHWMADVYTFWQWEYNLSSKEISLRCDAEELAQRFYPLHETSLRSACRKLMQLYFPEKHNPEV